MTAITLESEAEAGLAKPVPGSPVPGSPVPGTPVPGTPVPEFLVRTDSPIGRIELTADDEAITSLSMERVDTLPHDDLAERTNPVLDEALRQLAEYFAGTRREFDLPLKMAGTPFQQAVWAQLQRVGWGEFVSYGELGLAAGRPGSGRAVGGAVGANPIPIIVGCHRVLASNQKITGYSGGNGIPTKVWLLDHESIGHL
ncbi:methylated-DNA--[protein]-cysteine S-methyltransferase [Subtercola endophyticus]|uniref:methylated-DNA--[protein]-cysteine S-methyltransferase n=1 Tax=Subtercola endophyticus TaxID=2895559 RepID=UPI001E36EFE1|nr:methylated-DNA--[protein]-cysteine S-methyltransferase [Subtercola endophyticus]UFS60057.1 methylated-DNA--[protein]-cysteine S-methyltransferase [Subtercola endophyticus]